ncbi:L-rhamnose mutarotase [Parapedobacter tibetensis]|uniref:L-rhamnose mutarotase n=1 Tax=Parapedobacter tibetensis TaxID=2972951 RepID=UPI00214DB26F|nr:L-rhamnose mutarotase [Parapedobacter tibetensis]
MKRYVLALDLQDDEQLIAEYEQWHRNVSREIKQSIRDSGIQRMEIYRFANRLFMVMETTDEFSFERKAAADAANPCVQEWEKLMWKYQKPISGTKPGDKWVLMDKIFELSAFE